MTNTILDPISTALAARAATITGVTAYSSDPGLAGLEGNPIVVVGLPSIDRGDLDQDSQLGFRDWRMTYPVNVYVDLTEPVESFQLMRDTIVALIQAIDADDQLGGLADGGVRVTSAEPAVDVTDTARPRLMYECSVSLLTFV